MPYAGNNPLFRHGAIRVSENRRYLAHADGTPFFWLADTGWNVPHLSTAEEWKTYLQDRLAKGFAPSSSWPRISKDSPPMQKGGKLIVAESGLRLIPGSFNGWIAGSDLLNNASLLAAPVLAWANEDKMAPWLDPGYFLADDQIILLARYMVARYGAHQTIWMLAGDAELPRRKIGTVEEDRPGGFRRPFATFGNDAPRWENLGG